MSEFGAHLPDAEPAPAPEVAHGERRRHTPRDRFFAALEVIICSGFPTQLILLSILAQLGVSTSERRLSIEFVGPLLLADAALVVALVFVLLRAHREKPRAVFLGNRPVLGEALLGLPLTLAVFGLVVVVLRTAQRLAPWLHNVPQNPLSQLIQSGRDAAIFALVATLAGGVREEIQRAFILRRFEEYLGGARVGLVVFSLVFGLEHYIQGWDAAITIAALGAFWGSIYLSRGSIVAPVVSHSAFNAAEILRLALSRA